jgi:hypothetical protein
MKKLFIQTKQESGQIIVLLAVSIMVLLVVAALAVDGGMLYTQRRFAQNAADASSLAGASKIANELVSDGIYYSNFVCTNTDMISSIQSGISTAQLRGTSNNFSDLDEIIDPTINHGIYVDCHEEVNNKYIDFYVNITTETPTSFLHLINNNILYSTVQAVTRLYPMHDLGYGNAIVALNPVCSNPQDGLGFSGTNEIKIKGGGLWSNNCIRLNGPPNNQSPLIVKMVGTGENPNPKANLLDPNGVNIINGTLIPSEANIWPSEDVLDLTEEAFEIKNLLEKECGEFTGAEEKVTVSNNQVRNLSAGRYGSLSMTGGELNFVATESSSLFCFANGITINGGSVYGDPVTIYVKDIADNKAGDISISANAEVTLIAPFADAEDDFSILDGILIFINPETNNDVFLAGDGTSYFAGTIFTLNGDVTITGNPSVGSEATQVYSTQIIAKNVDISGNVAIDINFDINNTSIVDSKLHLLR